MKYIKQLEAYRLGEGEFPKWLKDALDQNILYFQREDMLDLIDGTLHKQAITGICNHSGTYPIDSYIVYEDSSVKVVKPSVFESRNLKKLEEEN